MLAQKQTLRAQLHALGIVHARGDVRPAAALVVDGRNVCALALDKIKLGRDAQPRGAQRYRSRVNFLRFLGLLGKLAALLIDPLVLDRPVYRVCAVRELALHPFEVCEAGTVNILVHHPHRYQRRFRREFGERQRKFALIGHIASLAQP